MMEASAEVLTEQEAAVYDRQIRVWGVDTQRRCLLGRSTCPIYLGDMID